MKDFIFQTDLLLMLRLDTFYGHHDNLMSAIKRLAPSEFESLCDYEKTLHTFVKFILDQFGDSEPFLSEKYIDPNALYICLTDHNLPIPCGLKSLHKEDQATKTSLDQSQIDYYFELACQYIGTLRDPRSSTYRNPLGRLVFKALISIREELGIYPTEKYLVEKLPEHDKEGIIQSIDPETGVVWGHGDKTYKATTNEIGDMMTKFRLPSI